ncbi:LamG-like jellyroll fold domain-containing protein [Aestuariivivens insulae]|uniref:LamG-like jellyroll fold domain-containing protein n=1 Tax=Aestuariivivens insulae TaxID=1621988 RepID=UPI001F572D60|nr:LamG-like jellyroll fold domain-containing protein [Aestuariivivens insulae]
MKTKTQNFLVTIFFTFLGIMAMAQSASLKFNGTDNVIDWSETDGVLRTSADHTWEMWIKGDASTVGVLYTEGWSGSNYRSQFRVNANGAGKLEIEYRTYSGAYLIPNNSFSTTTVFDGTWHHIAIVGTTTGGMTSTVLYVDGVADATDFGTYLRPTVWDNTDGGAINHSVIGQIARESARTTATDWYNGEIDEFRAWKRALSQSEIANNACNPASTTNLHRHVRFNEGAGTTFADEIGGADGILQGTTNASTYTTNDNCDVFSPAGAWSPVGDVILSIVTDDGDNGDGVGDGALFVDGQSQVVGQGVKFTFDQTMTEGTTYTVVSYMYNLGGSYCTVRVSLHNSADGELAYYVDAGTLMNDSNPVVMVVFSYTATAADDGDSLELRYIRTDDGHTARNFAIDNASINKGVIDTNTLSMADHVLNKGISVYPNPTRGILNINKQDSSINIKSINLIDVTGKIIYSNDLAAPINVSRYARGIYVLKIESLEGGVATRKVVVN